MNRILLTLATASIFVAGCGRAALDHEAASPAPALAAGEKFEPAAPAKKTAAPATEEIGAAAAPAAPSPGARQPGDFVVYRFTGSFRKAPLTLSEKVVARNGATITVDLALTDGESKEEMRIRIDESSPTHNEVVSAARLEGGAEKPATIEAYEKLMLKTTLSADANEALMGTEDVTVDVGGSAIPAKSTTYRVRIGKKTATLKTFESAAFAWGDVGGEIVGTNGKVLYRAQVIDTGHDQGAKAAANTP